MDKENKITLPEIEIDKSVEIISFSTFFIYNFVPSYKGHFESHKQFELIYVAEGEHIVINNNKEYILKRGQAFLHSPYSVHIDKATKENSKVYIISFSCISDDISILFDKVIDFNKEDKFIINEVFEFAAKYLNIDQASTYYSGKTPINHKDVPYGVFQIMKNKLELLFINLISINGSNNRNEDITISEDRLTNEIIRILNEMKADKFSLDNIAEQLNYSKNYLCGHFKKDTGSTISQYFYTLKINEAKKLLSNTNDSISSISSQLSFINVQYFSLMFKKAVGITPSTWRQYAKRKLFY